MALLWTSLRLSRAVFFFFFSVADGFSEASATHCSFGAAAGGAESIFYSFFLIFLMLASAE